MMLSGRLTVLPTSYRVAGRHFFEPVAILVSAGWFGRPGRAARVGADVPEPAADAGREPAGSDGTLPRAAYGDPGLGALVRQLSCKYDTYRAQAQGEPRVA